MDNSLANIDNFKIEYLTSKITLDFLLFNSVINKKDIFDKIKKENIKVKIENITTVRSDLYPTDECPSGEKKPGSRIYRVEDIVSAGDYYFGGDELNPKNGLIIFTKSIRYGRTFKEICDILKNYLERDLRTMDPPTLACIGEIRGKEYGNIINNNLVAPVIDYGWTYLPTLGIIK